MPASYTPTPPRSRRLQPSQGGVPPKDRTPRGGGDDGGEGNTGGERGPREALYRFRRILSIAILSDGVLFLVLAILFFARKGATPMDPRTLHQAADWVPIHLPGILYLNTAVLLLSCVAMERARRKIFREIDVLEEWLGLGQPALTASRRWLAASAVLGVAFLVGQWTAWRQLAAEGLRFGSEATPSGYFVFLLTGVHALHVGVGLGAILFCLAGVGFLRRMEARQIAVDATAWFWHAMGVTWVALFLLLCFGQ